MHMAMLSNVGGIKFDESDDTLQALGCRLQHVVAAIDSFDVADLTRDICSVDRRFQLSPGRVNHARPSYEWWKRLG